MDTPRRKTDLTPGEYRTRDGQQATIVEIRYGTAIGWIGSNACQWEVNPNPSETEQYLAWCSCYGMTVYKSCADLRYYDIIGIWAEENMEVYLFVALDKVQRHCISVVTSIPPAVETVTKTTFPFKMFSTREGWYTPVIYWLIEQGFTYRESSRIVREILSNIQTHQPIITIFNSNDT